MKIVLNHNRLAKALGYTARATSQKPNIPVLANVALEVTRDDLRLSATNLDMGINMWIGGAVETEGRLTASGKFLSDFVSAVASDKVQLWEEGTVLVARGGESQAEFQTIPATEFPILPKASGTPVFTMIRTELIDALEKVMFSCSTDMITSRIQTTGVLWSFRKDQPKQVVLVGTNTYRLSRKELNAITELADDLDLIIPARSLGELSRILSAEDESETVEVYLTDSKSQVIFKFADIEVSIRLLEGPYPDYQRIVPTEHSFSFEIEHNELEQALKVVNTFARSLTGKRVNFDLDLETAVLTLHTEVTDLGKNETKVKVSNTTGSSDLKAAFSLDYLIDMVNHIDGDKLRFESKGPLAPAVFTDKQDKHFLHLVMPMQREM